MDSKKGFSLLTAARATAGAMLLGAASMASAALYPPVDTTWDPTAIGMGTAAFTFDNIGLRQYSWIDVYPGAPSTFTDNGFLVLNQFTDNPGNVITQTPATDATPYSLYLDFTGSGFTAAPFPPTVGLITSLSYTLYADTGLTSFVPVGDGSWMPSSTTLAPPIVLGTGSLWLGEPSPVFLLPSSPPVSGALVYTTFAVDPGAAAFFVNPTDPGLLIAAFTNTTTVTTFIPAPAAAPGALFRLSIDGGGGNATLAVIPEPETYAMLLAGLGLMGFVARRRTRQDRA